MAQTESALFTMTPRSVSAAAVVLLTLAAFFGFLNNRKMKTAQGTSAIVQAAANSGEKLNTVPTAGVSAAKPDGRLTDAENRATKAEIALAKVEKEKTEIQSKLDTSQQELAALRQQPEGTNNSAASNTAVPVENAQSADLQSQIDDLRHQLDGAEKEKALLADKLQEAQDHPGSSREAPKASPKKRRETTTTQRERAGTHGAGVHGTVLAYNQAYNFVVLNLGARNGVEANAEMLVLREGTLIGKIRISSVEPATSIGDIITNSLARGVQVQPGDSVIYAGTSP